MRQIATLNTGTSLLNFICTTQNKRQLRTPGAQENTTEMLLLFNFIKKVRYRYSTKPLLVAF
jgi:hypothetical protein